MQNEIENKQQIHVCFASDNNYAFLCGAAIASILKNADKNDFINVYILNNNISEKNKKKLLTLENLHDSKINFVQVENSSIFDNAFCLKNKGYLSKSAYLRFLIPSAFKNLDKIIYFDCDIIATSSLSEFFNTDISDYYAAMIKDTSCEENQKRLNFKANETYYNSGVLLINLKKWKDDNIEQKLINHLQDGLDDQDIINIVLKNHIKEVDETWNYQKKAKNYAGTDLPKIIHFITAFKPYFTGSKESFNKQYFLAIKNTAFDSFYTQHLRKFCLNVKKQRNNINISIWGLKTRIKF